jgi:hypothetical protein
MPWASGRVAANATIAEHTALAGSTVPALPSRRPARVPDLHPALRQGGPASRRETAAERSEREERDAQEEEPLMAEEIPSRT